MVRQLHPCSLETGLNAMLRITVDESSRAGVVLRLEGRITGPWVEELRTVCDTYPDETRLLLDLADIAFADRAGVALLRELRASGADLRHASPLIAEEIKDETPNAEIEPS